MERMMSRTVDDSASDRELRRLRDALDHIRRIARGGVKPTRRLDWIATRSEWALRGRDWDADDSSRRAPTNDVLKLQKENAELRRLVRELKESTPCP
jgi:hypothetical protein